jgi:hypothetical protein
LSLRISCTGFDEVLASSNRESPCGKPLENLWKTLENCGKLWKTVENFLNDCGKLFEFIYFIDLGP